MNKGIYLKTADIYLRFPEIMEEECNDLAEFLEDEHIVYEGATDIVYNLQQENQRLKEELKYTVPIVEHNKIVSKKLKENQKYKEVIDKTIELTKNLLKTEDRGYYQIIFKEILKSLGDKE